MAPSRGKDLKEIASKRADFRKLSREVSQGLDLNDLDNLSRTRTNMETLGERVGSHGNTRLQAANEFGKKMQEELGALCIGVEEDLRRIGFSVSESFNFQGAEKFWAFVGKFHEGSMSKAQIQRIKRLESQDVRASVKLIVNRGHETIEQLGEIERDFEMAAEEYNQTLTYVIQRLKEAQPRFKEAKTSRESLEAQVKTLKIELESGTISEDERPAREEEFDRLQREYQAVLKDEIDLEEIINNAQRAIPGLQKSRDSALASIQSYHQMRRGLLELLNNFKSVLDNSMVAVKAQARLERYDSMAPSIKKTVALVTENNIKHAGAAMQIAIEHAAKAALDPEKSMALAREIKDYIDEYMRGLSQLEEEISRGSRVPIEDSDQLMNDSDRP